MKIKIILFLGWFFTLLALASVAVEIKQFIKTKQAEKAPLEIMVVPQNNEVHRNLACKQRIQRKFQVQHNKSMVWNT